MMNGIPVEAKAIAAAITGNTIFGLSFLFSKVALEQTQPFVLLSIRFAVAFVILNIILLSGRVKLNLRGKPIGKILILGIVQPILYFTFENYGINCTSTAFAGSMLALAPVAALAAGLLFLGEIPTRLQAGGAVLSVIGVIIISMAQEGGKVGLNGAVLLLLAVCSSVAFSLISRKTAKLFTVFERTYVMFALGSIFFTLLALIQTKDNFKGDFIEPLCSTEVWISIIYLSGFASVGAFLLINYSVSHLSLARASVFTSIVTIVSIIAGVVFLKESFTVIQMIGSIAILTGVYAANRPETVTSGRKSTKIKETI